MSSKTGELSSIISSQSCHHFSLAEIQSATNDFDDKLVVGEGGFGKVYKGYIRIEETSHFVAIKRLDSMSDQGVPEFRAEIEMLSKLRHCHLVSLIGFCDHNKEMILVYEYMPHGTLYHHLHKADTPLNWVQRLKIAVGAARGLDYLHTGVGTQHGIIHRDVKSSNILLDENWAAMISDFGLSKAGPTNQSVSYVDASVKGTFGYLDPEYFYTRRLTRKTDVFAFGVVLFELLSGRLAVDSHFGEEQCSLVRWAQKCVKDRKLDQMVDSNIMGTISPKCLRQFAQIAYRCVHGVPKNRPSMTEVVASLQVLLKLQEKHNYNSVKSSGKIGFTWKIHKYFVPKTKQNPDLLYPKPELVCLSHDASGMDQYEPAQELPVTNYTNEKPELVHVPTKEYRKMATGGNRLEKVKRMFQHFDLNRDGGLNGEEMATLVIDINPRVKFNNEQISAIVDEVFSTYGNFIDGDKGLTFDGLLQTYDDGNGDVDRDFATMGLELEFEHDDNNNNEDNNIENVAPLAFEEASTSSAVDAR